MSGVAVINLSLGSERTRTDLYRVNKNREEVHLEVRLINTQLTNKPAVDVKPQESVGPVGQK